MAASKKEHRRTIDKLLISLGLVATVALLAIGAAAWWAHSFTSTNVRNELSAQKIYFPAKDSPALAALKAEDRAQVSKYAGQQVLNGDQAKVFANNYIGAHLEKVANGKTYAEVSTEARSDPTNAKLKGQVETLFKGETLRGLLLGDAYAFWTIGKIAEIAAIVAFAAGGLMAVLVLLGFWHLAITR